MRIGAVTYLNTRPLVYGLEHCRHPHELIYDLPSRLADQLAAGSLDVALIPSIEYLREPSYAIVSDACIACRGPVLSVKLFSRVPFAGISSIQLDEGSRTSAALVQILLRERFALKPLVTQLPIGATLDETTADAVLLIGDRAIHARHADFPFVWDLGDEWCRFAELPFVFAVWTARPGIPTADVAAILTLSRDVGMSHLEQIADEEASRHDLTTDECLDYFRRNLYFYFGPQEQRGLRLFAQHAARIGEAPAIQLDRFHDCSTSG